MFIKRKVFEKFMEVFLEMVYRLDYVRIEYFDGIRDIWVFFYCIIDKGYILVDEWVLLEKVVVGEDVKEFV